MVAGRERPAGKSAWLLVGWRHCRGAAVADLRDHFGLSLYQPFPYAEADLLLAELAGDRSSRFARALADLPDPDADRKAAEAQSWWSRHSAAYRAATTA